VTRILVVDDEPQILRTLRINLRARAYEVDTHYLRQYMAQLRRKLEDDPARPRHLLTEPGMGYRLHLAPRPAEGS
jgi:DNA-binding response OmpR family regulator